MEKLGIMIEYINQVELFQIKTKAILKNNCNCETIHTKCQKALG